MPSLPHRKLRKPKVLDVDKRTVVLVDESSAVNIEEFQILLNTVKKNGGTVIFCGDPAQLQPVDGPSPFPFLCSAYSSKVATLNNTRRQDRKWQRQMVEQAREHAPEALETLRGQWVHFCQRFGVRAIRYARQRLDAVRCRKAKRSNYYRGHQFSNRRIQQNLPANQN